MIGRNMARVTVAIPVYNGQDMIGECLTALQEQTFKDFKVIICDNASTDRTVEICKAFAEKDDRFILVQNETNIGHEANFRKAFALSQSEFFAWRADDDYCTKDYFEKLFDIIAENDQIDLAAPSVITRWSPDHYSEISTASLNQTLPKIEALKKTMMSYHASWFYGLWRRDALEQIIDTLWQEFPYAYSRDHLTILRPLLSGRIAVCPEALFIQRTYSAPKGDGMRGKQKLEDRIKRLQDLMPLFYQAFEKELAGSSLDAGEKSQIASMKKKYTYQKLRASPWRIMRLQAKKLFGAKV
ncbi:MAG: glycosyltransferase [Cohaesibacter sp.]|nr:glycosyltransferase [Cohaesibacter sp.]